MALVNIRQMDQMNRQHNIQIRMQVLSGGVGHEVLATPYSSVGV